MRHSLSMLRAGIEAVYPATCALCRGGTGTPQAICPDCWSQVAFLDTSGCVSCSRPIPGVSASDEAVCDECLRHKPVWQRGAAACRYEGAGRTLVLGLKHGDRLDLAPMLGRWLARAGGDLLARADLVAPVPLHWTRRLKRRVNQAAVLARETCRVAGCAGAFAPRLLLRTRRTGSQDGKDRAGRSMNVAGAFRIGPEGGGLDGRRVLLIDDVFTTGATLNEAARTCLDAGAKAVDILVLALVVGDERPYIEPPAEDESDEDS